MDDFPSHLQVLWSVADWLGGSGFLRRFWVANDGCGREFAMKQLRKAIVDENPRLKCVSKMLSFCLLLPLWWNCSPQQFICLVVVLFPSVWTPEKACSWFRSSIIYQMLANKLNNAINYIPFRGYFHPHPANAPEPRRCRSVDLHYIPGQGAMCN